MYRRIVLTALLAGGLAGVLIFVAHLMTTAPLILQAEVFEGGPQPSQVELMETVQRSAYSFLADLLMSIGYAFLLVGAIALSDRQVDWRQGLIWGLCGFAAFSMAPSLGLAPELPGMQSTDLPARQLWWAVTAAATAGGLALIFLGRQTIFMVLGAVLITVPHVVGAPELIIEAGAEGVPPELAAEFAVASLVISGLFWLALGGFAGYFFDRIEDP